MPNRRMSAASNLVPLVSPDAQPTGVLRTIAGRAPAGSSPALAGRKAGVAVAVVDTGIKLGHPDLNVQGGHSCLGGTYDDTHGHGTHIAGTIGARNQGSGLVGVAPERRCMP